MPDFLVKSLLLRAQGSAWTIFRNWRTPEFFVG
jgi:hypothetical protein